MPIQRPGRLLIYQMSSIGILIAVAVRYFSVYQQFYPAMVALAQSRIFSVLLVNTFVLALVISFQAVKTCFLGKLRDQEVERATENCIYHLAETLLALTVFSSDRLNMQFVALLVICITWRVLHWIASSRLDYMLDDAPERCTRLTILRLAVFLSVLLIVDAQAGQMLCNEMKTSGPNERILLLQECCIMSVVAITLNCRILIHLWDRLQRGRWEGRGSAKFHLEILSDITQCLIYITFFFAIWATNGIPINLLRDLFITIRRLFRTFKNFTNYRRIAANLDRCFPDATDDEITHDPRCSICFDDMQAGEAKKLQCGHIFHRWCLRQWLERQTTCPYCRQQVDVDTAGGAAAGAAAAAAAARQQAQADGAPGAAPAAQAVPEAGDAAGAAAAAGTAPPAAAGGLTPAQMAHLARTPFSPQSPLAGISTASTGDPSEDQIQQAYQEYQAIFDMRSLARQASDSQAVSAAPPAPAASGRQAFVMPTFEQVQEYTPSAAEVEIYRDFHRDMHRAYSELHRRLKAQEASHSAAAAAAGGGSAQAAPAPAAAAVE